jgi:hypothetical protein
MKEFVLFKGEQVCQVLRKDHYGNKDMWLVQKVDVDGTDRLNYVFAKDCVPLDPALNILFERKENE